MKMTLRERIRFTRVMYGLTTIQVGQFLGVSRNYISMIENNNGNVSATSERLVEILNSIYKLGEKKKLGQMEEVLQQAKNNTKKD